MEVLIHCKYDELVNPKSLKDHPKNRNKHGQDQIERLAELYKYHGIRHPIIVSKQTCLIVAGHGRKLAALRAGIKQVPVVYQEFESSEAEYAFIQSDNAIAEWSELDLSAINTDLADLGPDFDIDMLGIKDFKLDLNEENEGLCDPDEVPEEVPTKAKLGDLFVLGNHRLLCGDSTDLATVERLMNGEKADLWCTDAPYGVSYADKNEFLNSLGNGIRLTKRIENDHMKLDDSAEFWFQVASAALTVCSDKSPYYWFACQGGDQMMMMQALGRAGWKVRHELIWVKNNHVLGRCDYQYKHEPILYGWKQDGSHNFYGGFQTSVLEFKKPQANKLHPTMKPVELIELLITNSSKPGDKVLETFGGSGTAVVACEKIGRKCRAIEIDPHYIDVIIARWQKFTGKKAVREDGTLWDDIEALENNKQNE